MFVVNTRVNLKQYTFDLSALIRIMVNDYSADIEIRLNIRDCVPEMLQTCREDERSWFSG